MTLSLIRKHNSNYERREFPARSEVHPGFGLGSEADELGRIREMPLPQ